MNISVVFSRNKLIGSRIISYFSGKLVDLEKVPSHVGILMEIGGQQFVVESVFFQGVRVIPYVSWLEINELCYEIPMKTDKDVVSFMRQMWGKKYDWLGIVYFAWRFVLRLGFNIPFPKENKLASPDKYFCNELVGRLIEYKNYSMVTPAKMCQDMLRNIY